MKKRGGEGAGAPIFFGKVEILVCSVSVRDLSAVTFFDGGAYRALVPAVIEGPENVDSIAG